MKIKITDSNKDKLEEALKNTNGKSTEYAFTTYNQLAAIAQRAETKALKLLKRESKLHGAKYTATSGQSVSKSYKYLRNVTAIVLYRGVDSWFLVSCEQNQIWPDSRGGEVLKLTVEQDRYAVSCFRSQYITE